MGYIILNSYNNYIEAHIAKGVLEEHHISCWLKDENTITIDPILTNAVGGIKVMIAKEDEQKALGILNNLRNEQKLTILCPACGSNNIELVSTPRKASNWISSLSTFFLGSFAIAIDKVNHCFDCEHEFRETQ